MDYESFNASLMDDQPPVSVSAYLQALWYDARGDWERAHEIVQDIETNEAALIHAYLHRKEGDLFNADYWYRRADAVRPDSGLDAEWEALVMKFLTS